jgi:large subunit ribosomal protein L23
MKRLLAPLVSEKSSRIGDRNRQHVFRVAANASKPEIRRAVELMFDVKVTGVQIANMSGKRKRFGFRSGRRPDWKKAYVTLAAGSDIDFMGGE